MVSSKGSRVLEAEVAYLLYISDKIQYIYRKSYQIFQ